ASLVSFSSHTQNALFEIEILQARICQLGNAQAACVKQLDHRAIAQTVNSFRVDLFEELLHLQFIERLREITLDAWERQRLSRVAFNDPFTCQEPEKNLQCHHDQLDRRGGEARAFATSKIFADDRQSHSARIIDFLIGHAPLREFAQRPLRGELVIFRKTALDCEETDKRIDRVFHESKLSEE